MEKGGKKTMSVWALRIAISGTAMYALGGNLLNVALAGILSVLPQTVDEKETTGRMGRDLIVWVLFALIAHSHPATDWKIVNLPLILVAGPLVSLLLDTANDMGAYLVGRKISLRLIRPRTLQEYLFLWVVLFILLAVAWVAPRIELAAFAFFGAPPLLSRLTAVVGGVGLALVFLLLFRVANSPGGTDESGAMHTENNVMHISEVLAHARRSPHADPQEQEEKKPEPIRAATTTSPPRLASPLLASAYQELCEPYAHEIEASGFALVISKVFETLDAAGDAPSVFGHDARRMDTQNDYDLLAGVTLADHAIRVARLCQKALQKQRGAEYWAFQWPDYLLMALGHDIAKAPQIAAQGYKSTNHSTDSANYLATLFREYGKEGKNDRAEAILTAIREHHLPDPGRASFMGQALIKCDREAREIEKDERRKQALAAQASNASPSAATTGGADATTAPQAAPQTPAPASQDQPAQGVGDQVGEIITTVYVMRRGQKIPVVVREIPEALVSKTLHVLRHSILNKLIGVKAFYGISQPDGWCYFWVDAVYDHIQSIAREMGFNSAWYFEDEHKDSVLLSFYRQIREKGWAPDESVIASTYYSNIFHFWNPLKDNKPEHEQFSWGYYMVIHCRAFGLSVDEAEAERKANARLMYIKMEKGTYQQASLKNQEKASSVEEKEEQES